MRLPPNPCRWTATASALALSLAARAASAEGKEDLDVRADEVSVDTRLLELELRGHVHADAPPFHLSADLLKLKRTPVGIIVDGNGKLAFCPCLGTPLTVAFSGATVAPPGDLILRNPRLDLFGIPVFWLPIFWIRSPTRAGLLPPDVAYRGSDGMYLGGGVHLPWTKGDGENGVDVRAGGYFKGGVAASIDLTTPSSFTRVQYDRLEGSVQGGDDGLLVDTRGALVQTHAVHEELAWNADLLRGARGLYATTDLEPVARPFDRVGVEARARDSGLLAALGVRADAVRGGPVTSLDAVSPVVTLAASGGLGEVGAANVTVDGGVAHVAGGSSLSYARGVAGLMLATRLGALGASASVLAAGDVASDGIVQGKDGSAHARIELTLPFGRAFPSSIPGDPWRHRIEPIASVSGLAADGDGALATGVHDGLAAGGGAAVLQGEALTAGGGLRTSLGRWAKGEGFELEGTAGTVSASTSAATVDPVALGTSAVARWRAAAQSRLFALSAEGAHLLSSASGDAWVARARVGETTGLFLKAWVASRTGLDPVAARLLTDPSMETPVGFLNAEGWTGGARAGIPWAKYVTTRGGVDVDFSAEAIVAAVGTLELRDGCGCFRLRATGAHRMGRDGVDVWISLDVTPEMLRR